MKKLITILCVAFLSISCTENQRTRNFGGTSTIHLPAGQKLFDVTWKGEDLWYTTRDRHEDETIETYTFQEESSFGILEGTVIFKER
jgi:hypothetical protein